MSEQIVVATSIWAAFVLSVLIVLYASRLYRRLGGSGLLNNTTRLIGMTALVLGIHHLFKMFFIDVPSGLLVAEGVEVIAVTLFSAAAFQLYTLADNGRSLS